MSTTSFTSVEAVDEANRLMTSAFGPGAPVEARRKCQEHLITLPSYPDYQNKAMFGTFMFKLFGEFEDLQDSAIDALLDLCEDEDEKVRIIGIKGLGPTGKADPRWVRGNTGVLLQLLACQPRELKYVKESLQTLLSVSPTEVFSVMMDDCKNSEEETGASRRNILEYIQHDTAQQRKELFETGKHIEAENILREGLFDIQQNATQEERTIILGILEPMFSVSTGIASAETKKKYVKALITSIPPKSPSEQIQPLIVKFRNYITKTSPIDSRLGILFISRYGEFIVSQALGKNDPTPKWLLDKLKEWTSAAVDRWSSGDNDKELGENNLSPSFVKTILPTFLRECKNLYRRKDFTKAGDLIEVVLYAIYRFTTFHDSRRERIDRSIEKALSDLAEEAGEEEKYTRRGSVEKERWANIVDMAEILADYKSDIITIQPSWRGHSNQAGPSSNKSLSSRLENSNNIPQRTATPPSGPRGLKNAQQPPSGPRNGDAGPSSSISRDPPSGPSNRGIRKPSPSGPSSNSRNDTDSLKTPGSPERRPKSPERIASSTISFQQRSKPISNLPPNQSDSQAVQPEIPIAQNPEQTPKPLSLADRLGIPKSNSTNSASVNKRPREVEGQIQSTKANSPSDKSKVEEKPSLFSRLGSRDGDLPIAKKVKEDLDLPIQPPSTVKEEVKVSNGKLSLFERINKKPSSASNTPERPISPFAKPNQGLNILNRSFTSSPQIQPQIQPKELSFLSRSTKQQTENNTTPSIARKGFSILNRASSNSSLNSFAENPTFQKPQPEPEQQEEVIVRKGRGFRAKTPEGFDIIMSDSTPPLTPDISGFATCGPSLNNGFGGFNGIKGRSSFGRNGRS
ncbi:uncharacterized protein L201_005364 [Kwoniella dendrophila CBS 6074]|uniref:Uncharacterized protein n=1 Tax=Kwoniella dendrophila CBS 6074 TaxID=1295534 RepID=A0AAX4JZY6_9TREE